MLWVFPLVSGALDAEYLGNDACAGCHQEAVANWTGSHHDLAMQEATAETVLGDFNDAQLTYNGVVSTFHGAGDQFLITTDNAKGELETFPVRYVFGVYPLQQYLLPLPGGRLQALSIAWDARPQSAGGQRWYHLYENDAIGAGDPLHWTGPYHNWNARCAECHSTDLVKGYDATLDRYQTRYAQIDVGCEACHGPGSEHVRLANTAALSDTQTGLEVDLAARGLWRWPEGAAIAQRVEPLASSQQIDTCGRCHARRGTLGEYHPGRPLLDTHRLALIEDPLYWPDGQIRDEVYVYGSFIQSKMHQAGVVCSNCHEPHSNQLVAEGNALCGQCHLASTYDQPEHHRHTADSAGGACVACHMPSQLYMVVDARRDHSMRIPRPDLSVTTGAPNACNQCHADRSADWAYSAMLDWGIGFADRRQHPARAFHSADRGDVRSAPVLLETANNASNSPILRASAITHLNGVLPQSALLHAAVFLNSSDPLIRISAVSLAGNLPPEHRYPLLEALVSDPILAVRMAVAEQLAAAPPLTDEQSAHQLAGLFEEYVTIQSQHLDMPSVLAQLGNFWRDRGDLPRAEAALISSVKQNPVANAPRVNLADLYRLMGKEALAREVLLDGIALNSEDASLWFSLGLVEIRDQNVEAGLKALERAAQCEPLPGYYHYVYGVALHDQGRLSDAITLLQKTHQQAPGQPNVLSALVEYSAQAGNVAQAQQYQIALQETLQAAGIR